MHASPRSLTTLAATSLTPRSLMTSAPPSEPRLSPPVGATRRLPTPMSRATRFRLRLFVLVMLVLFAGPTLRDHRAAATLLGRFSDPKAEVTGLDEGELWLDAPRGKVRAKTFAPKGARDLPGVVLVHGIQYQGIDEARILRFARAFADTGVMVLMPEVAELSDYHVDPRSIGTVGAAIEALRARTGRDRVGLMGMSFGGGIALLTAAREEHRDHVGFVVAVGAHDDLARTLRFFATHTVGFPDGTARTQRAHDYGAMVLVYNRVPDFFPEADREEATLALRAWLHEKRDLAREHAKKTAPASHELLEEIFTTDLAGIRPELRRIVETHAGEDTGVSPHGHLDGLRAPVYLLHGEDDVVIPSAETLWLANDVPKGLLREALVSPAIRHVEVDGEPTLAQKWALLRFMGRVIGEARSL